tara:strand:- start:321 stop:548 length:228 start_codon:yes stop_codon:yes gene_type:complete
MSSEKQWKEIFSMLNQQDRNITVCKTCSRYIYYSIKNNEISSFHTKNSDEQVCCFKHLETVSQNILKQKNKLENK